MYPRRSALNQFAACSLSLVDKLGSALAQKLGRPESELTTLISVRHCDHFTVGWLSEVLRLTHSAAVRIADRLERDGLLQRVPMENRRYVGLALTAQGSQLADTILRARRDALESHFAGISDAEIRQAMPVIEKLLRAATTDELTSYQTCRQCDAAMCGKQCAVDQQLAALDLGAPRPH